MKNDDHLNLYILRYSQYNYKLQCCKHISMFKSCFLYVKHLHIIRFHGTSMHLLEVSVFPQWHSCYHCLPITLNKYSNTYQMYTFSIFKLISWTRSFQIIMIRIPSLSTTKVVSICRWDHKLKIPKKTDYYEGVHKICDYFCPFQF